MSIDLVLTFIQFVGGVVGVCFALMVGTGFISSLRYRTTKSGRRAEAVRIVIPTVAAERVRPALLETIDHTLDRFAEYELYCVVDEGSDLQAELEAREDLTTVVVPAAYECDAVAKGRAMHYFIETVVDNAPEYWYAFLDDDNRILDDDWLYEIPHYEDRGYGAMNPVLVPRAGRSLVTFMADHIRFVDDITVYRLFTGVLGRPYLGFHGELLCARGDVLREIGFDRRTNVEDFAFALELVDRSIPVWQSSTRVSVLSPHDVTAFLKQRSRWYLGIIRYLDRAPRVSKAVVGFRMGLWSLAVTSSWLFIPVWILGYGHVFPLWMLALLLGGTVVYLVTMGLGSLRVGGLTGAGLLLLTPVYATLEHMVPLYALWTDEREFVVIEK